MVVRSYSRRLAIWLVRSPAATAKTIRACWTWNQAKRRLPAMNSKIGASALERVSGRGFRPRISKPRLGAILNITDDPNLLHDFVAASLVGERAFRCVLECANQQFEIVSKFQPPLHDYPPNLSR